jgi:1-acyl-sn-glycerol-3-phosphate acyltransferase
MTVSARTASEPANPRRLSRKKPLRFKPRLPGAMWGEVLSERPLGGRLRAARRTVFVLLWTLACMPVQLVLLALPGGAKNNFPKLYYRILCWLIGLKLQVIGRAPTGPTPPGATLYVSNHTSWLDVLVLGAILDARFVSKAEVGTWPLLGWVAKLGRSVFVSRERGRTGAEARELSERLRGGESLILFPEGTTSDGARVLPFRSSFFAVAGDAARVQPLTVVYDRSGGLPACRRDRPITAWYGDMETASHAWRLLRGSSIRATVVLHEAFPPAHLPNRKTMAVEVGRIVSMSAAALRQNRPALPLAAPARRSS